MMMMMTLNAILECDYDMLGLNGHRLFQFMCENRKSTLTY